MMYDKSDYYDDSCSDPFSISTSSPEAPFYIVQSPLMDSAEDYDEYEYDDEEDSLSPIESPDNSSDDSASDHLSCSSDCSSQSSLGSSDSDSSSGTLSTVSSTFSMGSGRKGNRKRRGGRWYGPLLDVIDEEDEGYNSDDDDRKKVEFSKQIMTQCLIGVLGFTLMFTLFCLIIWGISKPYKAEISVKNMTVHYFYFGEGLDHTGVPTKMATINCSLKVNVYNPATFFGIYVSSPPVNLMYSGLTIATGQIKKYYQPRLSRRTVDVNLKGNLVPLYGAGLSLINSHSSGAVSMKLLVEVRSQGNVVGFLVKTKHTKHLSCSLVLNTYNYKPITFKEDSCIVS